MIVEDRKKWIWGGRPQRTDQSGLYHNSNKHLGESLEQGREKLAISMNFLYDSQLNYANPRSIYMKDWRKSSFSYSGSIMWDYMSL